MTDDPNQFSREAWDANAEVWDARMGDEGNDFFNIWYVPYGLRDWRLARNRLRSGKLPLLRTISKKRAQSLPSGARCVSQRIRSGNINSHATKLVIL
jgi:hypothetical protein